MYFSMQVKTAKGSLEWSCQAPSVEDGILQFEGAVLVGEIEGLVSGDALEYSELEIGWAQDSRATSFSAWD